MKVVAVHRRFDCSFQIQIIIQIAVLTALHAVKNVVVIFLQSVLSLTVCSRKADDISRQRSSRIDPSIVLFKPDSLDERILLILSLHKGLHLIIGHALCGLWNVPSARRIVLHIVCDLNHIQLFEGLSKQIQGGLQIFLFLG